MTNHFLSSYSRSLVQGSAIAVLFLSSACGGDDEGDNGGGGANDAGGAGSGGESASGGSSSTGGDSASGGSASGGAGSGGDAAATGGSDASGGAEGGERTGPCYDEDCSGTCVGDCVGGFVCDEGAQICTGDVAEYCGCDGVTFTGSGSCPQKAYQTKGSCDAAFNCDTRDVTCRRLAEPCPQGQVRAIEAGCYGSCIAISSCGCTEQDDCPDPNGIDEFACVMSRGSCDYYVN